jgi:hypothetical protein
MVVWQHGPDAAYACGIWLSDFVGWPTKAAKYIRHK